jgi:hypothetical protein
VDIIEQGMTHHTYCTSDHDLLYSDAGSCVPISCYAMRCHDNDVLLRVSFRQSDVWEGYVGSDLDCVHVDIYEPWLQPATTQVHLHNS